MDEGLLDYVSSRRRELVALAYVLTGNRESAEDAVQDATASILAAKTKNVDDVAAYSRRAVMNACATRGRKLGRTKTRHRAVELEWRRRLLVEPDPFGRFEVLEALQTLKFDQRAAIVLRYFNGLPDDQIASHLGCAPATVRSHLARGLSRLRAQLREEE